LAPSSASASPSPSAAAAAAASFLQSESARIFSTLLLSAVWTSEILFLPLFYERRSFFHALKRGIFNLKI